MELSEIERSTHSPFTDNLFRLKSASLEIIVINTSNVIRSTYTSKHSHNSQTMGKKRHSSFPCVVVLFHTEMTDNEFETIENDLDAPSRRFEDLHFPGGLGRVDRC